MPSSCHAKHIIENIPYSIALRLFKITSEKHIFEKVKEDTIKSFQLRGSVQMVKDSFAKVEGMNRIELIYQSKVMKSMQVTRSSLKKKSTEV